MDHLLQTMKSIVQLDEQLSEYRKTNADDYSEIRRLENHFIDQLIQISAELHDPTIDKQVQKRIDRLKNTTLLTELRPIVLSGSIDFSFPIMNACFRHQNSCKNNSGKMRNSPNQYLSKIESIQTTRTNSSGIYSIFHQMFS